MCVGLRSRCRSYLSATLQGKHPRLLSVTVSHVKSSDTETCRKFAGIGWHLEKTLYKGENQNSHWYNTTNEADIVLTYLPILSIHVIHSYIQISIQRLYLISINFKFWNLSINLFITRISYLQFILIILTKIAYFILTTHVLKTLSIRSLLDRVGTIYIIDIYPIYIRFFQRKNRKYQCMKKSKKSIQILIKLWMKKFLEYYKYSRSVSY